jgi:hypothetical protein
MTARTMARTMAIVMMATMKNVPLSALEVSFSRLDIRESVVLEFGRPCEFQRRLHAHGVKPF